MKHIEPLLEQIASLPQAAQQRPLTALGEAYEYHTRRARFYKQSTEYELAKGDQKFANAHLMNAEFHTRLATACREADEQ